MTRSVKCAWCDQVVNVIDGKMVPHEDVWPLRLCDGSGRYAHCLWPGCSTQGIGEGRAAYCRLHAFLAMGAL